MIYVSRKPASSQDNDKQTLSSSKIVSLFIKRSKKSNITNRIKKIKFFNKKAGPLQKKRKALGRIRFLDEKDLYMKSHRFSKFGF